MKAMVIALVLTAASPAAAQCVCGGVYSGSTWGGDYAIATTPDYPSIEAFGYRNGYGYSDDYVYGPRGPLTWPYVDRPFPRVSVRRYWRGGWRW